MKRNLLVIKKGSSTKETPDALAIDMDRLDGYIVTLGTGGASDKITFTFKGGNSITSEVDLPHVLNEINKVYNVRAINVEPTPFDNQKTSYEGVVYPTGIFNQGTGLYDPIPAGSSAFYCEPTKTTLISTDVDTDVWTDSQRDVDAPETAAGSHYKGTLTDGLEYTFTVSRNVAGDANQIDSFTLKP